MPRWTRGPICPAQPHRCPPEGGQTWGAQGQPARCLICSAQNTNRSMWERGGARTHTHTQTNTHTHTHTHRHTPLSVATPCLWRVDCLIHRVWAALHYTRVLITLTGCAPVVLCCVCCNVLYSLYCVPVALCCVCCNVLYSLYCVPVVLCCVCWNVLYSFYCVCVVYVVWFILFCDVCVL